MAGIFQGSVEGTERAMGRCVDRALGKLALPHHAAGSYELTVRVASGSGAIADGALRRLP
jgi:hypothetical protein